MKKREEKKRREERHCDVRPGFKKVATPEERVRLHAELAHREGSEVFAVGARSAAHSRERGATVCRAACSR
eukprot:17255-Rhodomonas_salina.1